MPTIQHPAGLMMFHREYQMLAFVPRWGIAPRITRQSVAEHSYYVALYSSQLCDFLDISGDLAIRIVGWALRHDAWESWASDMPGPSKRFFIDEVKLEAYITEFGNAVGDFSDYRQMCRLLPVDEQQEPTDACQLDQEFRTVAVRIIKIADLIDECMYLRFELALGNSMVRDIYSKSLDGLRAKVDEFDETTAEQIMYCVTRQLQRIESEGALIHPLKDATR